MTARFTAILDTLLGCFGAAWIVLLAIDALDNILAADDFALLDDPGLLKVLPAF